MIRVAVRSSYLDKLFRICIFKSCPEQMRLKKAIQNIQLEQLLGISVSNVLLIQPFKTTCSKIYLEKVFKVFKLFLEQLPMVEDKNIKELICGSAFFMESFRFVVQITASQNIALYGNGTKNCSNLMRCFSKAGY